MEEIAKHAVPAAYRSKLRELFDALDKNRNGYLVSLQLVREVQLLGYAITGKVPSHAAATREMKRYKELEPEALRLSWPQFLLFSRSLATLPVPRFVQVIDTYLVKIQRAEPRISIEDLQRLNRLHADKLQGLHGMGRTNHLGHRDPGVLSAEEEAGVGVDVDVALSGGFASGWTSTLPLAGCEKLERRSMGSNMGEEQLYEALIHGTKASNSFPGEADDLEYFASLPEFQARIAGFRDRLVKLIMDLAENADSSDQVFKLEQLRDANPGALETFEPVSEIIDMLLENVDESLDASRALSRGVAAGGAAGAEAAAAKSELVRGVRAGLHGVITHAKVDRPQKYFAQTVDNLRTPFRPVLHSKPNAIVPLPDKGIALRPDGTYPNPYETEIQAALGSPPAWLLEPADPVEPVRKLEEVPCTWVETETQLQEMCNALAGERAIAIDLENHSYRSFQGFVCLMQVSTRSADYLVDTLALRSKLHALNEHFTNPSIVKVFHGADSDVVWLQRDFGLYLVSLFDTGRAARALSYPSAGLAYALKRHVDLRVNKAFQLADWRVRPLPDDMFRYAREDTHYLLHVFDKQRNELLEAGGVDMMRDVLRRSAEVALATYAKDTFNPDGFNKLLERRNLSLSQEQLSVLAAVYGWRDTIARREDESVQYVLPDRMLLRVAQEAPASAADLERCCNPLPAVVQTRVTEVLALVRSAREAASGQSKRYAAADADEDMAVDPELNRIAAAPGAQDMQQAKGQAPQQGSVQMGLNSSRSSFVPIQPKSSTSITFAEAAKSGLQSSQQQQQQQQQPSGARRGSFVHMASSRATPSPVLTTEQLYDTAGWQDIGDPDWKAQVILRNNTLANARPAAVSAEAPRADNYRAALAAKTKIGEEQLKSGAGFGALPHKTPFAAMATAMSSGERASSVSMDGTDDGPARGAAVNSGAGDSAGTAVGGPTGPEDAVIDIDTPADADALESEDIPRSMAEIYRISNRNRKRNKDKKKLKDDNGNGPRKSSPATKKRGKDASNAGDDSEAGAGDDAIDFMRDIGWVEGGNKPVPSLVVEGAPDQPAHLAGASADTSTGASVSGAASTGAGSKKSSTGPAGASQTSKAGSSNKRGRRNTPNSPKHRPANSGNSSGASGEQQQQQQQQPRQLHGYAKAAAAAGAFSYSQVAANNGRAPASSAPAAAGSRGRGSGPTPAQAQQQYRSRSGAAAKSMSYR
ncbi:Exosome component 10 [Hondaea fermentalgiana]|uniref:Exosome component 10 n=1 Tax=Hondaea fermentalgiana TaxID=2315210 RepID=A0A2R5GEG8_9STRA|nr:Exosome component 10 [Hondaea fermentalgiana]|eukprot:GBG29336.1 Exosome component 10 [Hondaea fermentalgiana]